MKYEEAVGIINKEEVKGFMVSFERKNGNILTSDHFPDKHAGEELIATEEMAWNLACQFAQKTVGECVNIYVIDATFSPVKDYKGKKIPNRKPNTNS